MNQTTNTTVQGDLHASLQFFPFAHLLPLVGVVVTLRFTAPARFGMFHQPALTAFLRWLLGRPENWENLVTLDALESCRPRYQAGDHYRFTVVGLPGSEALMVRLFQQLVALPQSVVVADAAAPLRDNVVLMSLEDFLTQMPVERAEQLQRYDQNALDQEAELWSHTLRPRLRWLSPVRLLRAKETREGAKGEGRYCHDGADLTPCLLADRLHDALADLSRRRGQEAPVRIPHPADATTARDLFWINFHYTDADGQHHPMGGIMGRMDLPASEDVVFWRLYILGQYLGIGQRRTFGWGRYWLESPEGEITLFRSKAAAPLGNWAGRSDNLDTAYAAIRANQPSRTTASWVDPDEEWAQWPDDSDEPNDDSSDTTHDVLARIGHHLAVGDYEPPALQGVLIEKGDGGVRPLAIPPFLDRVAQRAVAQVMGEVLEPVMYEGSFGYRPGRSRVNAKDAILRAYQNGYRWVYEADIDDFFDSVDHTRLHTRLVALLGADPLVSLILQWMAAPVRYQDQLISRSAGLPQGSPLSPLLANLLLDDFDHDLAHAGFRLVRYADDLVVLCRDRPEAEAAQTAVQGSLASTGLAIDPAKSRITTFEHGFRYLGFLFVNSLALDVGKPERDPALPLPPPPPNSWYARLLQRHPRPLTADGLIAKKSVSTTPAPLLPVVNLGTTPPEEGTTLYVTGAPAFVTTRNQRLVLERDGKELLAEPWHHLAALVLIGPHHITTPALRAAMQQGIPVHFANAAGKYQGVTWHGQPGSGGVDLWPRQQAHFADPINALAAARSVVEARLRHQREILRQRGSDLATLLYDFDHLIAKLPNIDDLTVLNGMEGQGARIYFSALENMVSKEFGFENRNRRPPRDPINLLLSLGYTFLHAHVDTSLRVAGLLPWTGFYHQPHGRHTTLASDLMEPFRHLVERCVLAAVSRKQIKVTDFSRDATDHCHISNAAFKTYATLLAERFSTPVTALGEEKPAPLTDHLQSQNRALIAWINGTAPTFHAWRMR